MARNNASDTENAFVRLQFQGCIAGVLVGDCMGFPYENEGSFSHSISKIRKDFMAIREGAGDKERIYSDDTSMTISVMEFLIHGEAGNYQNLARRFFKAYSTEAHERSYGSHVHRVFFLLQSSGFADAFQPASEQFNGQGSLGNGSGMRVAPLALYTINDPTSERLVDLAINVSRITHTHPQGIAGGIFQALAVRHALLAGRRRNHDKKNSAEEDFDPIKFLKGFEEDFTLYVKDQRLFNVQNAYGVYRDKIKLIRKFIGGGPNSWTFQDITRDLGVKVTAAESIPTGLFCFLAAFRPIPMIEAENQFERTLELAIAVGGDTDTIGAMAGAIAGAFLTYDGINPNFVKMCEQQQHVIALANDLFHAVEKGSNQ